MSTRLRAVARETMDIVANGGYRAPSGRWAEVTVDPALTRLHLPGERLDRHGDRTPLVEVTNQTTLQAARELGGDPACLVFASAKNPGGGFLNGAKAQEEDVARASALYACLTAAPEFYTFHRQQGDLRYSDRVIYSPGVPVFRDDRGVLLRPWPVRSPSTTSGSPCSTATRAPRRAPRSRRPSPAERHRHDDPFPGGSRSRSSVSRTARRRSARGAWRGGGGPRSGRSGGGSARGRGR